MGRRVERVLRDLLRVEGGAECRCGEPIGPEDRAVILMGEECGQPGAGMPRCRRCAAPLLGIEDVRVVYLPGAVRVD